MAKQSTFLTGSVPAGRRKRMQASPKSELERLLYREYRRSGNSAKQVADKLGVSPRVARRMLSRLSAGEPVFKYDAYNIKYVEKFTHKKEFLQGDIVESRRWAKRGKKFAQESFTLTPGHSLPIRVRQKGIKFQVIIEGKIKGEKRVIAGQPMATPEQALNNATKLMQSYKKFAGSSMDMKVLYDGDDIPDEFYDEEYEGYEGEDEEEYEEE